MRKLFDLKKAAALFTAVFFWVFSCFSGPALALDATSFDPRNVSVEADSISGVPIGTIITWPVATNPEGWDEGKWLECNGQSVNPTVYPELFALVGATVPDLRGLFLRGQGGNAATLGSVQEDAGRNITGSFSSEALFSGALNPNNPPTGAFFYEARSNGEHIDASGEGPVHIMRLDASRVWGGNHTATEFRPINRAVRYLIRAA